MRMQHQEPPPKVSVLLPVFNGERYLQQTLESLRNQTLSDFEIVAVDDGSTDSSLRILQSFPDPRLRVERNERNLGIIETLNRGIRHCRAAYIARMDADDVAHPERLEKQYRYLEAHPRCVLVATGRKAINEQNKPIRSFNRPASGSALIRWKLLTGNFITHPTVMMRKDTLPIPLFEERFRHAEDYAAWLRLLSFGDLEVLPERLLEYRFHGQSVSHLNKMPQVRAAMDALGRHLLEEYGVRFQFESLALWSAPQDAAAFRRPDDFARLVRWMNPLRPTFRSGNRKLPAFQGLVHYYRRLALLLLTHRRRPELVGPVLFALATSIWPWSFRDER